MRNSFFWVWFRALNNSFSEQSFTEIFLFIVLTKQVYRVQIRKISEQFTLWHLRSSSIKILLSLIFGSLLVFLTMLEQFFFFLRLRKDLLDFSSFSHHCIFIIIRIWWNLPQTQVLLAFFLICTFFSSILRSLLGIRWLQIYRFHIYVIFISFGHFVLIPIVAV